MFTDLISQITPFIEEYGVFGVFFLSIIEEIVIPIPSSLPLLAAGFFLLPASAGFLETLFRAIYEIAIPGAFGLTLGGLFGFSIAYIGGEVAIKKWGKWLGVSWSSVEKAKNKFSGGISDEFLILSLRTLPFVPNVLISLACGLIKYPTKRFIFLTFIGSVLRALLMSMFGWSLGGAYAVYASKISQIGIYSAEIIGALFVLLIVYALAKKKYKRHRVNA